MEASTQRNGDKKNLVKNMSVRQTQSDMTSQYNEFREGTQ
jgi:hypothetical protein